MPYKMRESRVPSSRFGRLWQYGGLATSLALGAAGESFRRATGANPSNKGSLVLSSANMERLVSKLSKMRGAALKLGQMMSFQGRPCSNTYSLSIDIVRFKSISPSNKRSASESPG